VVVVGGGGVVVPPLSDDPPPHALAARSNPAHNILMLEPGIVSSRFRLPATSRLEPRM